MDTPAEALAYDRMDHAQVNRIFVDDLLAAGPLLEEVLDLGTGTALIPIELCGRNPSARVLGIDLSASMLHLAQVNVEVAGLTEQIMLDLVDCKELPYDDGRFALVMSNSIGHHIPQPQAVFREAWRVLAQGGWMFVRDLVRPASQPELEQLVALYAATADAHQRQLFSDSLRAALSLAEVREQVSRLGVDSSSVQQTSDRHWTWSVRKP